MTTLNQIGTGRGDPKRYATTWIMRPEPLLEAKDIAQLIGMTEGWIWAQTRAKRIPHVKLGRFYRYRWSAIEKWLEEIEQGSTNPVQ